MEKKHDYHLVDISAMPILSAFSLMFFLGGAVFAFSGSHIGYTIMGLGLISLIACMFLWWKDVIKEAIIDKAHTKIVRKGLTFGVALFILSEVMFFIAFFWSFFTFAIAPSDIIGEDIFQATEGIFPPEGIQTFDPFDIPLLNTLLLLLSGSCVTWAHYALIQGDKKGLVRGLFYSVLLGIIFSIVQVYEYSHATFLVTDGIYPSNFYLATGFHGIHVIVGTIFLAVCYFRARKGHFDIDEAKNHVGFEAAAWYWHFVDVVWLFLYVFVYVWGR